MKVAIRTASSSKHSPYYKNVNKSQYQSTIDILTYIEKHRIQNSK